jgi:beta-N-acetylhexosaminidase
MEESRESPLSGGSHPSGATQTVEAPSGAPPPTPAPPARRPRRRWALIGLLLLLAAGAAAYLLIRDSEDEDGAAQPPAAPSARAVAALQGLSVKQKVDAVVASGFSDPASAEKQAAAGVGALVVRPESWSGGGGQQLLARLHAAEGPKGIGPLIVGLQEGGIYGAYPDLPPAERQLDIGEIGKTRTARTWAEGWAGALKAAGFDLNAAPLADVATLDSAIADRAFGDEVELVSDLTRASVRGCESTGLACAVGHFPGQGSATQDPDLGPATVSLDDASLKQRDLVPFEAAFEAKVPAVVLSNAYFAAYDPVTPASLSPTVATNLLRDQLGFKGVAITDDLTANSVSDFQSVPEAAVAALAAGADLVAIGDPAAAGAARTRLLEAARGGEIPLQRLDQAVARVLDLKREVGLLPAGKGGGAKAEGGGGGQ